MPKFNIPVTRDCTETTMVDVEATTVEEAIHRALVEANDEPWKFNWTHDDNSGDQNVAEFVGDPDEIEIDDEASASHGDEGSWVSAWVYVPRSADEDGDDRVWPPTSEYPDGAPTLPPEVAARFDDNLMLTEPVTGAPIGPPRYCVDGHEFADEDSAFAGDGQCPPFVIFDIKGQDNLPGVYPTREAAQVVVDQLNAAVSRVAYRYEIEEEA